MTDAATTHAGRAHAPKQRRGEELRRHVLFVAKDVFLEQGYERASMDTVAARAGTSKRTLYAHFESKDTLFRNVLDLIRELYLGRLQTPRSYADDPAEAAALFCGRFLQLLTWEPQVRICRLTITEAERRPDSARAYHDAMVASAYQRLADYLAAHLPLTPDAATRTAAQLLDRAVLPRLLRTLLGAEPPTRAATVEAALEADVDLAGIRALVTEVLPQQR